MHDLEQRIRGLSADKQELLRRRLEQLQHARTSIAATPREGRGLALSFAQQRLWFLTQLHPQSAFYNVPLTLRLREPVDIAALQHSLDALVRRHETLRTTFAAQQGEPLQYIGAATSLSLAVYDMGGRGAEVAAARATQVAAELVAAPFDLERGPLVRAALLVGSGEGALHLVFHHIITDGESLGVFARELAALYAGQRRGQPVALPPLPFQYADYASWQRENLVGPALERELDFWRSQLGGPLPQLRLPYDRVRPSMPSNSGGAVLVRVPAEVGERLAAHARAEGTGLFAALLAGFELSVAAASGQRDMVVGTPIAGRKPSETEALFGFFANTVVLRTALGGDPTFREALRRVRDTTLAAYDHDELPFDKLVEHLQPERDLALNPLFQATFTLQPSPPQLPADTGMALDALELNPGLVRFDLECHLWQDGGGATGQWLYATDLFERATVERLARDYEALLARLAEAPDAPLSRLAGVSFDTTDVEHALVTMPGVVESAVRDRHAPGRGKELVAYVVAEGPWRPERLAALLAEVLPPSRVPTRLVPVARLPLLPDGALDDEALARLPVLDREVVQAWEDQLLPQLHPAEVAVVVTPHRPKPAPLALADVLPRPALGAKPKPAAHPRHDGRLSLVRGASPPPLAARTLAEVIARAAREHGASAIVYVGADGRETEESYAALFARATCALAGLRALGLKPGDPVLFQLDVHHEFLPIFWACMLGGMVVVPLSVPVDCEQPGTALDRLLNTWERLGRAHVVARTDRCEPLRRALERHRPDGAPRVHDVRSLLSTAAVATAFAPRPEDLGLLLLTSGSTGVPKLVQLSHANIVARSAASQAMNGFGANDVSLNWMPLEHVGGIVMFHVRDVYVGCRQVQVPTPYVLANPNRWLDLVHRHHASITWAPNFAFGLVNESAATAVPGTWDLSRLRHILNGGEAVVSRTARRFLALLAPHGLPATAMRPAWGMSETSSGVTDSHAFSLAASGDDDTYVEVGGPIPGVSLRVVKPDPDPAGEVVPEGVVGALQVTGPTVTRGYWQNDAQNREAFTADGWFRTGDLARIVDGRLTITGREKDVIIINGANYPCHEIEAVVERVEGVLPSWVAACAVREGAIDTDALAIFVGGTRGDADLVRRIRERVVREVGVNPDYVVPVACEDIPKTNIGKIQRAELRARFERGELRDRMLPRITGANVPAWFFERRWVPRTVRAGRGQGATLVLFADNDLGDALAEGCPGPCIMASLGERFVRKDARSFVVEARVADRYAPLLAALAEEGSFPERVLCLHRQVETADTQAAVEAELLDVLALVQAVARARPRDAHVRVLVAAGGANAVAASERAALPLAGVTALLESATVELDWLAARVIDLCPGEADADARILLAELGAADREPLVAYRGGERLVQRFAPADVRRRGDAPFRAEGFYLITGGLGGIGRHVAALLRERFGARVLLVGRTPHGDAAWRALLPSHLQGDAGFRYAAVDVVDETALTEVVNAAAAAFGVPFAGVLHLAGTFTQRPIMEESPATFVAVLRPKVQGALTLRRLLAGFPEASFIAFSSVNGWMGGANAAAYAAANACLDSLCENERRAGRDAQALAWSLWSELGMSRGLAFEEPSRARGFAALRPQEGLDSLLAARQHGGAALAIGLDASMPPVRRRLADGELALDRLCAYTTAAPLAPALRVPDRYGTPTHCQVAQLEALPRTPSGEIDRERLRRLEVSGLPVAAKPQTALEKRLADVWGEVLGVDELGLDDSFFALGGHSLLATRLLARLAGELKIDVPLPALFAAPTVRALAAWIERMPPGTRAPEPSQSLSADSAWPQLVPDPARRHEPFSLTDVQAAYWIGRTHAFALGGVAAHEYMELDCPTLDVDRFEAALRRVIDRHDMLRAVVLADGRQQVLREVPPYVVTRADLRSLGAAEREQALAQTRATMSHAVSPADRWPLFDMRASLLPDGIVRLHVGIDALVLDAHSWQVIGRELVLLYGHQTATLAPLDVTFRDYVLAEARLRDSPAHRQALAYWRERLASLPGPPDLPLATAPASVTQPVFRRRDFRLGQEGWRRMRERAQAAGVTVSSVLVAAFAEALTPYCSEPRFTLNLTLFNRLPLHPQVNDIVGDFTSLSLLAVDLTLPQSFAERARAIQTQLWRDLEHRQVNAVRVLAEQARARGSTEATAMPVVFSSGLALGSQGGEPLAALGRKGFSITQTPQVWLDHQVTEADGALDVVWDSVDALFPPGLIDGCFGGYTELLTRLAAPGTTWQDSGHEPLSAVATLAGYQGPAAPVPDTRLEAPFFAQAALRPEQPAVVAPHRTVTYGELAAAAAALAVQLQAVGVGPGAIVAVVMRKGWEQVVAVLGVLRAGGAYLPIDARVPTLRRNPLMEEAGVRCIVTQSDADRELAWPADVPRLRVEPSLLREHLAAPAPAGGPLDIAYVIYTSGSTGHPKGVVIDHRGALNTLLDINRRFGVGAGDRVLAVSALDFDLSVYDIFGMLAAGGTIVMPAAATAPDPVEWASLCARHGVTVWNSVPALMDLLVDYAQTQGGLPPSLRQVWLSGDWIPVSLPNRIRAMSNAQVVSLGGATEGSIWSIVYPIDTVAADASSIPYGRALANQAVYVLDPLLRPRPTWVPGELYIGGVGVARGYLGDEARTAQQFVFHPRTGERLYRTGDLGRRLPDGNLEFLGRQDNQVKVQGYRVELEEIEAVLTEHPAVQQAVVVALGERQGDKRLVAYVVATEGDPGDLRAFLGDRLPAHLVPPTFVRVAALPLSANGKVDRRALAARPPAVAAGRDDNDDALAVRVAAIVCEMLSVPSVDWDENLFALGATSITVVRIVNAIDRALGVRPAIEVVYRAPSVRALARACEQAGAPPLAVTLPTDAVQGGPPTLLDPQERAAFKRRRLGLRPLGDAPQIALPPGGERSQHVHHSQRSFATTPLRLEQLAGLVAILRATEADGRLKYAYGSAGGLYPVQVYLVVKPARVEGLAAGAYYHHPVLHRLALVNAAVGLDLELYDPLVNRPIAERAAFAVFLVGAMDAMEPMYGAHSPRLAALEAGAMCQLLEIEAVHHGLGLCQVGGVDDPRARALLGLSPTATVVHSLLGGALPAREQGEL